MIVRWERGTIIVRTSNFRYGRYLDFYVKSTNLNILATKNNILNNIEVKQTSVNEGEIFICICFTKDFSSSTKRLVVI